MSAPAPTVSEPLSELNAFIQMDGLLASLHKDYLDAKAQRIELVALYGDDDAMAEVAIDMEDSAWCAMQTRYLEVREQREMMERAQRLMRRVEEKIEQEKAREKEYEARQFSYYLQMVEKMKELNKVPQILQWAVLLLLFKIPPFDGKPNPYMQQNMSMSAAA